MINIDKILVKIELLIKEDTESSLTYAALEARLALEKICYDRLRQAHDYISHDQLSRWQPNAVMNTLITHVDKNAAKTMTLRISKNPAVEGIEPVEEDFVDIGTQVGFDSNKIRDFWNALSRVALHAKLPTNKDDHIPPYGDKAKIKNKVLQVVKEIKRISKTTMVFSGFGDEVSFECHCGEKNKRRAELLKENDEVYCINPSCQWSWIVEKDDNEVGFKPNTVEIECDNCSKAMIIPWRKCLQLKYGTRLRLSCHNCKSERDLVWALGTVPLKDK
ncbi:hypothetical protein [Parasphingorhabdus sp.]|uniref:hypothetical protein n=1 Tax=Parasphingorhabdus sp. TaxID=2709688 RepID=UPI003A937949